MKSHRKAGAAAGALFLIAMAASLTGGTMIHSVLAPLANANAPSESRGLLLAGILLELVNGMAVIGIGVLLHPILKAVGERAANGYLCFRVAEAAFCLAAMIAPMALLKWETGEAATQEAQAAGMLLMTVRDCINGLQVPVLFCAGAAILYSRLYASRLLPRFIPAWGMLGAALILTSNIICLFRPDALDTGLQMAFGLPIILNEVFMGCWLVLKGFGPSKLARSVAQ